jgi:sulfite reductase alpha subunit-like flavoprotein
LLDALAGLVATVATGFALVKNNTAAQQTAKATTHANAALAIASVIANQPTLIAQAIQAGTKNGSANTVAAHIDAANSPV